MAPPLFTQPEAKSLGMSGSLTSSQPTRSPGAKILEKVPRQRRLPSFKKWLKDLGAGFSKCSNW